MQQQQPLEKYQYRNEDLDTLRGTLVGFLNCLIDFINTTDAIDEPNKKALAALFPKGNAYADTIPQQYSNAKNFYETLTAALPNPTLLPLSLIALPIATCSQHAEILLVSLAFFENRPDLMKIAHKHQHIITNIQRGIPQICESLRVLAENIKHLNGSDNAFARSAAFSGIAQFIDLIEAFRSHWEAELPKYLLNSVATVSDNLDADDDDDNDSLAASTIHPEAEQETALGVSFRKPVSLGANGAANTQNHDGDTLLIIAAKAGDAAVASTALMLGCDPSTTNNAGLPAIAYALDKPAVLKELLYHLPPLDGVQLDMSLYKQQCQSRKLQRLLTECNKMEFLDLEKCLDKWSIKPEQATLMDRLWYPFSDVQINELEHGLNLVKAYQMLRALINVKKRAELLLNLDNDPIFVLKADIAHQRCRRDFLMLQKSPALDRALFSTYESLYQGIVQLTDESECFKQFMRQLICAKGFDSEKLLDLAGCNDESLDVKLAKHISHTLALITTLEETVKALFEKNQNPLQSAVSTPARKRSGIVRPWSPLHDARDSKSSADSDSASSASDDVAAPVVLDRQPFVELLTALQALVQKNVLSLNAYLNYVVGCHLNGQMPKPLNLSGLMAEGTQAVLDRVTSEQTNETTGAIVLLVRNTFDHLATHVQAQFIQKVKSVIKARSDAGIIDAHSQLLAFLQAEQMTVEKKLDTDSAQHFVLANLTKAINDWTVNQVHLIRFLRLFPQADVRWDRICKSPSIAQHPILGQRILSEVLQASVNKSQQEEHDAPHTPSSPVPQSQQDEQDEVGVAAANRV